MAQLVQLNESYEEIKSQGGELLAIHLECAREGTTIAREKAQLKFHLANDERLEVSPAYSPTSTYLIGLDGRIKYRWLDRIHQRVTGEEIIEALKK